MQNAKAIALCIAIGVTGFLVGSTMIEARGPAATTSRVPASVFLNALSNARTFAGPGLVSDDDPNASGKILDDPTGTSNRWLSVQNTGDSTVVIERDSIAVLTIAPGRSITRELTINSSVSFVGQGDGSSLQFVWVFRD